MRRYKSCAIFLVQVQLALSQCWDGNPGWSYAPPYFVPYIPEESIIQNGQPVYFGPPQEFTSCPTQCNSYTFPPPAHQHLYTGYENCLPERECCVAYGNCYQQPGYLNPMPGVEPPCLSSNGEPIILLPENNCGVKYVPPIACDNSSPCPYLPPIIIINNDDDDDDDDDFFGFDRDGRLSDFLSLFLALQGRPDGNPFTPLAPPPPPPPSPPPGDWGYPGQSRQNCQCCCCNHCRCCPDSDGNSDRSTPDSGCGNNNGGTTTHITIVLPKSWGVPQIDSK